MSLLLQQIDTNTAIIKAKRMQKELKSMDTDMLLYDLQIGYINRTYRSLLMKDRPVGSGINAVKELKNKENTS